MTFRVGSLFSGMGGIDLGLEQAGMTVLWQVEIDKAANRVLAHHWPNVRRYEDVREAHAHTQNRAVPVEGGAEGSLAPVDIICAGFP